MHKDILRITYLFSIAWRIRSPSHNDYLLALAVYCTIVSLDSTVRKHHTSDFDYTCTDVHCASSLHLALLLRNL